MSDKISTASCAVAENIGTIRNKISAATLAYQTQTGTDKSVNLVAVSKRQSDDRIDAALNAGQRVFGENRVQEAKPVGATA